MEYDKDSKKYPKGVTIELYDEMGKYLGQSFKAPHITSSDKDKRPEDAYYPVDVKMFTDYYGDDDFIGNTYESGYSVFLGKAWGTVKGYTKGYGWTEYTYKAKTASANVSWDILSVEESRAKYHGDYVGTPFTFAGSGDASFADFGFSYWHYTYSKGFGDSESRKWTGSGAGFSASISGKISASPFEVTVGYANTSITFPKPTRKYTTPHTWHEQLIKK